MFPEGGSNIQELHGCLTFEPIDLEYSISFNVNVFVFVAIYNMLKSNFDGIDIVVVDIRYTISPQNMKKIC